MTIEHRRRVELSFSPMVASGNGMEMEEQGKVCSFIDSIKRKDMTIVERILNTDRCSLFGSTRISSSIKMKMIIVVVSHFVGK